MATLYGTTNNDYLYGTSLNDIMYGYAGDDTFRGSAGADTIYGGAGIDAVDYSSSFQAVTVNLQTQTGSGGDAQGDKLSSIENLFGSNSNQGDSLTGDSGNNSLYGLNGSDFLFGGAGKDILVGGLGSDTMSGGADPDVFVISPARWSPAGGAIPGGQDVITDFQVGEDVLEFTGGIDSLADLSFATVGNDTVISFGNNGVAVTLVGVGLDQLMAHQAHDFLFV